MERHTKKHIKKNTYMKVIYAQNRHMYGGNIHKYGGNIYGRDILIEKIYR